MDIILRWSLSALRASVFIFLFSIWSLRAFEVWSLRLLPALSSMPFVNSRRSNFLFEVEVVWSLKKFDVWGCYCLRYRLCHPSTVAEAIFYLKFSPNPTVNTRLLHSVALHSQWRWSRRLCAKPSQLLYCILWFQVNSFVFINSCKFV